MSKSATEADTIVAYLNDEKHDLTEDQLKKLERLEQAADWIRIFGTGPTTRKKMLKHFRKKHGSYSVATASRDINEAQQVFGAMSRQDNEFWKQFAIDNLVRALHIAMKRVEPEETLVFNPETREEEIQEIPKNFKMGDMKVIPSIIKELRETTGYDKEILDLPKWDEIGPHPILVEFNPKELLKSDKNYNIEELEQMYFEKGSKGQFDQYKEIDE